MLVSGDGDFIHLVNALRPYGKNVIVVALSWTASPRLTESADQVVYYDRDVDSLIAGERDKASTKQESKLPIKQVFEILSDIVREARQSGRTMLLTQLKVELLRRYSHFKEADYSFQKFKPLVLAAEKQGYIQVVTQGLVDWAYLPDEGGTPATSGLIDSEAYDTIPSDESSVEQVTKLHTLSGDKLEHFILFAYSLEQTSPFVAFNYLVNKLFNEGQLHLDRRQTMALVNDAIAREIFVRDTYEEFNEFTGETRTLPVIRLNRQQQMVSELINREIDMRDATLRDAKDIDDPDA